MGATVTDKELRRKFLVVSAIGWLVFVAAAVVLLIAALAFADSMARGTVSSAFVAALVMAVCIRTMWTLR